jgi:hypothetical protein
MSSIEKEQSGRQLASSIACVDFMSLMIGSNFRGF